MILTFFNNYKHYSQLLYSILHVLHLHITESQQLSGHTIEDIHMIRLASRLSVQQFQSLMLNLGLENKDIDNITSTSQNHPVDMIFWGLLKWKNRCRFRSKPTIGAIQAALSAIDDKRHHFCQVT